MPANERQFEKWWRRVCGFATTDLRHRNLSWRHAWFSEEDLDSWSQIALKMTTRAFLMFAEDHGDLREKFVGMEWLEFHPGTESYRITESGHAVYLDDGMSAEDVQQR